MNSKSPLISVIVCAYNAESFIERAVNSVLSQTYRNIELIIVNDGSTDSTNDISKKLASKDSRIRLYQQTENKGIASARQFGISKMKGEFSIHLDSDDYCDSNMIERMYSAAEDTGADVVIADYFEQLEDSSKVYKSQMFDVSNSSDVLIKILRMHLMGSLCNKLIRSSIYQDKNLSFTPGLNYCEDVLLLAKMFKDDDVKVIHLPEAFYYYCHDNENSITIRYDKSKFASRLFFLAQLEKVLVEERFEEALEWAKWFVKIEAYWHKCIKLWEFNKYCPNSVKFLMDRVWERFRYNVRKALR